MELNDNCTASDALRIARDSVKDNGKVTTHTEQPIDQDSCKGSCDESEDGEISKDEVTTNFVDSKTMNSSTMYTRRTILFYFLLSSTFAVILSFWIVW